MEQDFYACNKCGTLFEIRNEARTCKHSTKVIDKVWGSKIVTFPTKK